GVDPFQGFYASGTGLDSLRFTVGSAGTVSGGTRTVAVTTHTPPEPPEAVETEDAQVPVNACVVDTATLEWAFKDEFLSYLDSTIAHGSWEVAGGATDTGTTFEWPAATGYFDP